MNFKRRGNRISLYRSTWMPRGPGIPHGHTRQDYIGSIEADATSVPPALGARLSATEYDALQRKVIGTARARLEAEAKLASVREADPNWRIDEALRLLQDAARRSQTSKVDGARVLALKAAAGQIQTTGAVPTSLAGESHHDPMEDALKAIEAAAEAVRQGRYGRGPATGFRKTEVFQRWTEILAAVDADETSLLKALQAWGFATRRTR